MISEVDKAYIAGLVDGEGTLHITNTYYLTVKIRNNSKSVLEWIQGLVGDGHIYCDKRKAHPCYSLEFWARRGLVFLELIMPYLRIKTQQAQLAKEFQEFMHSRHPLNKPVSSKHREGRNEFYLEMKRLNSATV